LAKRFPQFGSASLGAKLLNGNLMGAPLYARRVGVSQFASTGRCNWPARSRRKGRDWSGSGLVRGRGGLQGQKTFSLRRVQVADIMRVACSPQSAGKCCAWQYRWCRGPGMDGTSARTLWVVGGCVTLCG